MAMTEKRKLFQKLSPKFDLGLCYEALLLDLGADQKSIDTMLKRCRTEGIKFPTVKLPELMGLTLQFLETGVKHFPGWATKDDGFPVFLHEFFQVFDRIPLDTLDHVYSLRAIRQICLFSNKMEDGNPISKSVTSERWTAYKESDASLPDIEWDVVLKVARDVTTLAFASFDVERLSVSHGPGSVSDVPFARKFDGVLRPGQSSWVSLINKGSHDHLFDLTGSTPGSFSHESYFHNNQCSEFLCVPKDSRGPRTICREQALVQFAQQGLRRYMERSISTFTEGAVEFRDQSVNAGLTFFPEKYATLDLKDASDRISYSLVSKLFSESHIWEYLHGTRSAYVQYNSERVKMRKWAPMGSAVCFTTLAWTIWVLLYSTLVLAEREDLASDIHVYGDDIVVPVEVFSVTKTVLTHYGFLVNTSKSFSRSFFRESCGTDAYAGQDITPVRLRTLPRELKVGDISFASLADTVHQLHEKHLLHTCDYLVQFLPPGLPEGERGTGYLTVPLTFNSTLEYYRHQDRMIHRCADTGRLFTYDRVLVPVAPKTGISESEWDYLYRVLLPRGGNGDGVDADAFGTVTIPRRARLCYQKKKIFLTM